jgi:predicted cupin superfamily sugar epimerase
MHPRASELIRTLQLAPHPEGGWYREVYRSQRSLCDPLLAGEREAMTTIYFLLAEGAVSHWHRLASDEVWHFCEGSALELLVLEGRSERPVPRRVGPVGDGEPLTAVPAGTWQAARTTGAYTLAGCTVAPGFSFQDFELLRECPEDLARLTALGFSPGDLL